MSAQKCSNCSAYWLQPLRRSCFVFGIGIRFCGMRCKLELRSIFEISPCVATGSRALARTRGRTTRSPRSARNLPTRRKRWKRHSGYRKNGADRCAAGRFQIWNRRRQNFSGNSDSPGAHRPGSPARTANRANEFGRTSSRSLVSTFIHPLRMRRHGNTSACGPSSSMTASSRSRSNGAVVTCCHIQTVWRQRQAAH